jgi:hypothetical protein
MKKSAEVIILKGNEVGKPTGLTIEEGRNIIFFKIRIGAQVVAYA